VIRRIVFAAAAARGHDATLMARATRAAAEPHGCQQKTRQPPIDQSNNLATIILDMRHVAGCGIQDDKEYPP
jgi:hypothetical protein